ncbi:hypothetical protein BH20GEM2_BH20GEM2_07830 [soil metagenome]
MQEKAKGKAEGDDRHGDQGDKQQRRDEEDERPGDSEPRKQREREGGYGGVEEEKEEIVPDGQRSSRERDE